MASGPRPELPTIITTDTSHPPPVFRFSSEDDPQQRELDYDDGLHSQENSPPGGHGRTPSLTAPNPAHLSPRNTIGLRPPSRDNNSTAPSSPGPFTPGTSERSPSPLTFSPPSPTGSARSGVHFSSTLQLRENDPDRKKGLDSLQFLHQHDHAGHGRRPSFSSMDGSTEGTEPDHLTAHSIILPLTPLGENNNDDSPMSRATSTTVQPSQSSPTSTAAKKLLPAAESNMPNEEEDDENVDPAPFAFRPTFLANLVQDKNFGALRDEAEGIEGVLSGLRTDPAKGLGITGTGGAKGKEELEARKRVYGVNELPARKSKSLFTLMWLALKDPVLVMLCVAAVVSLVLGLYQDFGTKPVPIACQDGTLACFAPRVDWVEGVAIMVAVIIVVVVGSLNDWQKEKQFKVLNSKKEERGVKVVRSGREAQINVHEVLVGDVCLLEPGEIVPCDGILLRGHNVRTDESDITGESDLIKKAPYEECLKERDLKQDIKHDCFIVSGTKVVEGVGAYVVVAVGKKSLNGRIMISLRGDSENTPLQVKLNHLAELIAKLGSAAGLILFTALMIKFFVQLHTDPDRTPNAKAMSFVQILIISVTLVVVAVPEGLPLAVTLALAFATKRMTYENLLVRVLASCETMANASVVCTDKTGTLTQNSMSVVAGSIGIHAKFVRQLEKNQERSNVPTVSEHGTADDATTYADEIEDASKGDFAIDTTEINSIISPALQKVISDSVSINSTAFEDRDEKTGKPIFVGSKTETALLKWAKEDLGWADYTIARESAVVVQMIPFSSERKAMGVVVQLSKGKYRFYIKGASEILTQKCTRHVVVQQPGVRSSLSTSATPSPRVSSATRDGDEVETMLINKRGRENISRTIIFYANQTLRTIALCYRDFDSWPPIDTSSYLGSSSAPSSPADDEVPFSVLFKDLTLIGITGIEDPLRPGVREAVLDCQKAGVNVKMCTGDNVLTARSIAVQCGIYTAGGIIMEGPTFRGLNKNDRLDVVRNLQVLARSTPEDKRVLVDTLKELGEIVGVTGDGSNDGPALKAAHVGFSMGIAGTEVAKEASDIILMDDNFSSIATAIMWGRCVNDAVRKFLQFQISVNITAVVVTFVSAVASGSEQSVLSAVQLLWINIIMDTFAALALATDPAHRSLLDRKPDHKTAPLFSVDMIKMIIGQSIYQCIVILVFHFAGNAIFGYHNLDEAVIRQKETELNTLVFNAFVFCQIFNSFNSRRIDNKNNIFEGILSNWYFMGITLLEVGVQVLIVFVGGSAFQVTPISGRDWAISLALGFVSIPLAYLIRKIPNPPIEKLLIKTRFMKDPNALPTERPDTRKWNPAITQVRDNLATFASVRGGRLRSSSFVVKSRSAKEDEASSKLPSLLMVPTLIASTIGAGWTPSYGALSDPAGSDPSRSSAALFAGHVQIHPDTKRDDPVFRRWGAAVAESQN